jgi:hypothetical protein
VTRAFSVIVLWALCFAGPYSLAANAPTASTADERVSVLEEKLERSLELIEQLSARVQELEAARTAAAPPVVAKVEDVTRQRLDSVEQQLTQIADANAVHGGGDAGVPLHGFADVGIGNHNALTPALQGANVGTLDLFLNPQLGERTRALFEVTFEVGDNGDIEADVERAQIGYQFSDAATLWVGRFHTPFGYYNTAFHHGQQIATSLRRPRFIQFEDQGGVMPNHTVGAWLTGAERISAGKVTYDVFVGNGQEISDGEIDPRSGGVDHGGAIFGGNLGYLFGDVLDGLKVGLSAFRSRISDDQQVGRITQVDNTGVYFAYDTDRYEYIGEFYRFSDTDLTLGAAARHSSAGFLQLGWRLAVATPYVRYERALLDQEDNFFALQRDGMSYAREALGVRFDIDFKSALKFEFGHTKYTDRSMAQWNDALLQYSIRF